MRPRVAHVLHAQPNPISQAIAAWPPLALLFTVELIARVPVHRRGLAAARLLAATGIAGIAAYVSYWHMVGVAARYGETGASPYLLPLSVDGLILVASVSLVEITGRLRSAQHHQPSAVATPAAPETPPIVPTRDTAPRQDVSGVTPEPDRTKPVAPSPGDLPELRSLTEGTRTQPVRASAVTTARSTEPIDSSTGPVTSPADLAASHLDPVVTLAESQLASAAGQVIPPGQPPQPHDPTEDAPAIRLGSAVSAEPARDPHDTSDTDQEVPAAPRDAIAYWQSRLPGISVEDLAERIGKSPRQIRRYLRTPASKVPQHANGRRNDTLADTVNSASP